MKMKYLFLACGMAALFAACQNENEPKVVSDKPGTSGDYRIIIEGEETDAQPSRSSGTIQFVGGTASGAGLYDGTAEAIVSATPDPGYEINYFYGGPDSEPKKYDNANGGESSFKVQIGGQDHLFHVGFKEKTGTLTINAGTGGTVSPSGQVAIQREVPFSIKATPNSGYEFAGWTVNNGNVTIDNANSTSTTATLNSTSGTITANFKPTYKEAVLQIIVENEGNGGSSDTYLTYILSPSSLSLQAKFKVVSEMGRDDGSKDKDISYKTYYENQRFNYYHFYDDGYGNWEEDDAQLISFTITDNGKTIYSGSEEPQDGTISNGYRFSIIK
jgi:hypothetical protein